MPPCHTSTLPPCHHATLVTAARKPAQRSPTHPPTRHRYRLPAVSHARAQLIHDPSFHAPPHQDYDEDFDEDEDEDEDEDDDYYEPPPRKKSSKRRPPPRRSSGRSSSRRSRSKQVVMYRQGPTLQEKLMKVRYNMYLLQKDSTRPLTRCPRLPMVIRPDPRPRPQPSTLNPLPQPSPSTLGRQEDG